MMYDATIDPSLPSCSPPGGPGSYVEHLLTGFGVDGRGQIIRGNEESEHRIIDRLSLPTVVRSLDHAAGFAPLAILSIGLCGPHHRMGACLSIIWAKHVASSSSTDRVQLNDT